MVAVRSEPPRPSVVTLPSGALPMKPGTTGVMPRRSRSLRRVRVRLRVSTRSGAAAPCRPSVATSSAASICWPRRPEADRAAATIALLARSPRATRVSLARAERSPSEAMAWAISRYSRAAASRATSTPFRAEGLDTRAWARSRCRRRNVAATCEAAAGSPATERRAPSRSWSVTPARAEATITSGPGWASMSRTAWRTAAASASEAPPNFQTCRGSARFMPSPVGPFPVGQERGPERVIRVAVAGRQRKTRVGRDIVDGRPDMIGGGYAPAVPGSNRVGRPRALQRPRIAPSMLRSLARILSWRNRRTAPYSAAGTGRRKGAAPPRGTRMSTISCPSRKAMRAMPA